jgi:MFS family permease
MYNRQVKNGALVLEAINSLATIYYSFFVYFYAQAKYGFGNLENLLLAAASGFIYMIGASYGGRLGQRKGYFYALRIGYWQMAISLAVGTFVDSRIWQSIVFFFAIWGMSLTWPNLEAIVSEGEPRPRLRRLLGVYNLIWAAGGAFAYFTGGAMLERLGLWSMFAVPSALHGVQLWLLRRIERIAVAGGTVEAKEAETNWGEIEPHETDLPPKVFLKLAWVANPFAYVSINTALPVIPTIAKKFQLSPTFAGIFCSLWMFSRLASFYVLRHWSGWHYRLGWLLGSYLAVAVSFGVMLTSRHLVTLGLAQIIFGLGLGLVYYSSLYYSMDLGDEKGEHGGFHEAAIGAGNCVGPAIGAGALALFPERPDSSAWAVSVVLLGGFVWILAICRKAIPRLR